MMNKWSCSEWAPDDAVFGGSTCKVLLHGLECTAVLLLKWLSALKCWRFIPVSGMPKPILLLVELGGEEPATEAASILGLEVVWLVDVERKELVLIFIVGPVPAFPCRLGRDAVYVCNHLPLHTGSSNSAFQYSCIHHVNHVVSCSPLTLNLLFFSGSTEKPSKMTSSHSNSKHCEIQNKFRISTEPTFTRKLRNLK